MPAIQIQHDSHIFFFGKNQPKDNTNSRKLHSFQKTNIEHLPSVCRPRVLFFMISYARKVYFALTTLFQQLIKPRFIPSVEQNVSFFYAHYFVSGKCHIVHSPIRAPQEGGLRERQVTLLNHIANTGYSRRSFWVFLGIRLYDENFMYHPRNVTEKKRSEGY